MKSTEAKKYPSFLHFDGRIYFAIESFSFKFDQYFLVTLKQQFRPDVISLTPISLYKNCLQGNPQNTPYIDVITLDTYLTIDNKIEDNETHHIQNQAQKH